MGGVVIDYVVAGYVALRPQPRPDWVALASMPGSFVNLSLSPTSPVCTWCDDADDVLGRFGVAPDRRADARAWIDAREHDGEILPADVSTSPEVVRAFVREFAPGSDARIVGYGLRADDVDAFISEYEQHTTPFRQMPNAGTAGIETMLRRREKFAPGGRVLGYEYACADVGGMGTSWVMHGLPADLQRDAGIRVNEHGYIEPRDVAVADAYVLRDEIGKEPGIWRPWLMVDYPVSSSA